MKEQIQVSQVEMLQTLEVSMFFLHKQDDRADLWVKKSLMPPGVFWSDLHYSKFSESFQEKKIPVDFFLTQNNSHHRKWILIPRPYLWATLLLLYNTINIYLNVGDKEAWYLLMAVSRSLFQL